MGQVWQLSVVACRGPLSTRPRARGCARPLPAPTSVPLKATGGVARSLTAPSLAAPLQITRDSKKGQYARGCGKHKRFHVLYYQTSETGWVPATKLKDFEQNLVVLLAPRFCVFCCFVWFPDRTARTVVFRSAARHCQPQTGPSVLAVMWSCV